MKVLVTGTGGFVGSHVVESLLRGTTWDVVCVDSLREWHNSCLRTTMDAIVGSGARRVADHITHDLQVPFTRSQVQGLGRVDYIVNLASLSQVDESIEHPREFVLNNVSSALTMLELARELRPRRFVHMSTDEVYGPHQAQVETDHRPSSPYAASKAAQEDLCHAYAATYDLPITIVNSANLFGPRQSTLAFLPKVIDWLRNDQEIPVHTHDGVPGVRNYTYVRDFADHVVHLMTSHYRKRTTGLVPRVQVPGQYRLNNVELVNKVASLMGVEPRIRLVDGVSSRPGYDPSYHKLGGVPLDHVGSDLTNALLDTIQSME